MFSKKPELSPEAIVEANLVRKFLRESEEFFKMTEIVNALEKPSDALNIVALLKCFNRAQTFVDIIDATNGLDAGQTEYWVPYLLGRDNLNLVQYIGGFFSPQMNFFYYMLHFREKAILASIEAQRSLQSMKDADVRQSPLSMRQ